MPAWSPTGKKKYEIRKKIKQVSESRDFWKSKCENSELTAARAEKSHCTEMLQVKSGTADAHQELESLRAQLASKDELIAKMKSDAANMEQELRSKILFNEKEINDLRSKVAYKEKERVRLESRAKYESATSEKSTSKR